MYISKLHIKNYKSIREQEFLFDKGVNVLVGKNSVGKSNIVSAIDEVIGDKTNKKIDDKIFFRDSAGNQAEELLIYLKIEEINENLDFCLINNIKRKTAVVEIEKNEQINFWNSDYIREDSDFLKSEYNKNSMFWNTFELKQKLANANSICLYKYINKITATSTYSMLLYVENRLFRIFYVNPNIKSTLISSMLVPAFRTPENMLRINEWTWYGKLLKKEWSKCCNEENLDDILQASQNLRDAVENVFGELRTDINKDLKETLSLMNVEIGLNMLESDGEDYYKSIKLTANDGIETSLECKGCGLQNLIIIELFKFYTKIFNKSSVLIVEEPELFLHPHARRMFADILHSFIEMDGQKNQIILTTHSNEFVQNIDIKNINVIRKGNGETKVYRIDNNNHNEKDLQKLKVELQFKNTEMFFAEKVILVEGEEVVLIPSIVTFLYDKNVLNSKDISVIKVGGKSYFAIYRKILNDLGIKNYIIADYDIIMRGLEQLLSNDNTKLNQIRSEMLKYKNVKKKVSLDNNDWLNLAETIRKMIEKRTYDNNIEICWNKFESRIYEESKLDELDEELKISVKEFIMRLYTENKIFIMQKGELENYYKTENFDDDIKVLPKGLKPYKIVELAENNIDRYLEIDEYKEILDIIIDD